MATKVQLEMQADSSYTAANALAHKALTPAMHSTTADRYFMVLDAQDAVRTAITDSGTAYGMLNTKTQDLIGMSKALDAELVVIRAIFAKAV